MQNFNNLIDLFVYWNSQINLSGIKTPDEIYTKHIQDSLELNKVLELGAGKTVADLGTGGGFPLLPLAMTNPEVKFIGIEAKKKKINAIQDMVDKLGLDNVRLIWSRGELHRQKYDYVLARALGYIDKIMDFGLHLVRKKGHLILYKMYSQQEFQDIKKQCDQHRLNIIKMHEYKLYEDDITRIIYVLKKVS